MVHAPQRNHAHPSALQNEISEKNEVVIGRSPILGKPMAMMLLNENATVLFATQEQKSSRAY